MGLSMNGKFRIINSRNSLELALQELRETWELQKWLMLQVTTEKQRSQLQNNSMHLWFEWVSQELNRRGLDMRVLLKSKPTIDWYSSSVKSHIWKPTQIAIADKDSTIDISTVECVRISDELNRWFGNSFGFTVPWPQSRAA
jgi:RNA recognition motif-containing protein